MVQENFLGSLWLWLAREGSLVISLVAKDGPGFSGEKRAIIVKRQVPPQDMETHLQSYTKELSKSCLNSSGHGELTTYQTPSHPQLGRSFWQHVQATTAPELSPALCLMLPLQHFSKMVTFATELSGFQRISQKTSS